MPDFAEVIRKLERKAHSSKHYAERQAHFAKVAELRARDDISQHEIDRPVEPSKLESALRASLGRPGLSEKDSRAIIEMIDSLVLGIIHDLNEFKRLTRSP
jgi:hypothetical protein